MTERKTDHINMAGNSAPGSALADQRFNYEPLLAAHPVDGCKIIFLGKTLNHPLWVSSMTGGAIGTGKINHLLAEACAEFGLGMGLGSCRSLLRSNEYFDDFNLRPILGNDLPFFANIGIAQLEELVLKGEEGRIHELVSNKLLADGLIIHVNPVQEWLQPEGDLFKLPPLETISRFIDKVNQQYKIIVKEVGQGIGPESLGKLLEMNIDTIEFGAFGGTNFANIEIARNQQNHIPFMLPLGKVGHSPLEMLDTINTIVFDHKVKCQNLIVSGGVRNFLDGYYYTQKSMLPAVYGMAYTLLKHAMVSKAQLLNFIKAEVEGYKFAKNFLTIKA
jgi:isopentenyl-diphosphate delta-isomerase